MQPLPLLHFNLVMRCCNLWLLFILSLTCFSSYCGACDGSFNCSGIQFKPPFGMRNSGCGDPLLQVHCVNNMSLLNISDTEYYIMEYRYDPSALEGMVIKVINKNLVGKECNLSSSNFTFRPSNQLHMLDGYQIIAVGEECQHVTLYVAPYFIHEAFVVGCDSSFYCSNSSDLSWIENCKYHVQLPVRYQNPNMMDGFEIKWTPTSYCKDCMSNEGICGYDINSYQFLCKAKGDDSDLAGNSSSSKSSSSKIALQVCTIGGAVLVAVCVFVFLVYYLKLRKVEPIRSIKGSPTSNIERFLEEYVHEMPTRYSYYELQSITNNFAARLGEGGFGVVYKGKLPNGTFVAVKILDSSRHSESQFMSEVATIGRIHHVNLVRLMGYCFDGSKEVALVYEFMKNGSLEKFIFPEKGEKHSLSWEQSYSIAVGAARGIAYLHQDCKSRIIHFDIKPHNVLLDEDFTPKIADFGLAKICGRGKDHISLTATRGTPGYAAPEVWSRTLGPVTDKSDVYSFGMLLLEIVGARNNFDVRVSRSSQLYFPEWVFKLTQNGQLDMMLKSSGREVIGCEEKAKRLTKVGLWCIQYNSIDRPSMSKVVQMLEGNGEDVSDPPMPFDSSTAPTVLINSSSSAFSESSSELKCPPCSEQ